MKYLVEIINILVLISIVIHGVEGSNTKLKFEDEDEDENLTLEEQLKSLNKPPISTFKRNGDIIDCIDIYKQPAFDHPLLKNHKLQLRPSSFPKPTNGNNSRPTSKSRSEVNEECPQGSVPIKRVQKEDLIREKAFRNKMQALDLNSPNNLPPSDFHHATVTTPLRDPSQQFFGAKTSISVYNVTITAPQLTKALLWIGSGVDGQFSNIEYGWTINPHLYNDLEPRTFSRWTADGLQKTGCYNALCNGYVQISKKRIMGEIVKPVSIFGESVYAMEFIIFKDTKTGNWWLGENLADVQNEPVGYWPNELFPAMRDFAKVVQFTGRVYSPSTVPSKTPMGSGAFEPDDFTRTCYASNIEFVDSKNQYYNPKDVPMKVLADSPDTYKGDYMGDVTKDQPSRGYAFLFGGPNIRS